MKKVTYIRLCGLQWADTGIMPGGYGYRTVQEFRCHAKATLEKGGYVFPVLMGVFPRCPDGSESRFIPLGFDIRDANAPSARFQFGGWFGDQPIIGRIQFGSVFDIYVSMSCERDIEHPRLVKISRYSARIVADGSENRMDASWSRDDGCVLYKQDGFGVNIAAGQACPLTIGGCRFSDGVVRDKFSGKIYQIEFSIQRLDGDVEYHNLLPFEDNGEGVLVDVIKDNKLHFVGDPKVEIGD